MLSRICILNERPKLYRILLLCMKPIKCLWSKKFIFKYAVPLFVSNKCFVQKRSCIFSSTEIILRDVGFCNESREKERDIMIEINGPFTNAFISLMILEIHSRNRTEHVLQNFNKFIIKQVNTGLAKIVQSNNYTFAFAWIRILHNNEG